MGEVVIKFVVAGHHFDAKPLEQFGCKCGCRAVTSRANNFEFAGHFEVANKVIKVGFAHAVDKFVLAAIAGFAQPV